MLNSQMKFSSEWQRYTRDTELCTSAILNETGSNVIVKLLPTCALRMPRQNELELGPRYDPVGPTGSDGYCDHKQSLQSLQHLAPEQHNTDEVQEVTFANISPTASLQMENEQAVIPNIKLQQSAQNSTLCSLNNSSPHSSTALNAFASSNLTGSSKSFQSPLKRKQSFSGQDEVSKNEQDAALVLASNTNNLTSACSSLEHLKAKKANKESLETDESTSRHVPPVGPKDFQMTISLSQNPWDMFMQEAEWVYIDKTGQQSTLNLNTSLLLDHLYNSCRQFNSKVRMSLPETGRLYDINLKNMDMTDVCTGEKTALFRKSWTPTKPLQVDNDEIFPKNWSPQNHDIVMVTLDQKTDEHRTIRNTFLRTMPECCVIGIERIQNKKLFIRYSFQKAVLLEKVSGSVEGLNEKMLFHGTSKTPPKKIWQSEDGFDMRYSRRGMWGIGSYFAQNSSYSDKYAYIYPGNYPVFREMIVANVLTGNSIEMQSNHTTRQLSRPPVFTEATQNNPEVLYDSVTGFTGGSQIYVVYKFDMAYPSYLIRYFHLKPG